MANRVKYDQLKFNVSQNFSYGSSSAQSNAFDDNTVAIMLSARNNTDKVANFTIGTNPTATSSHGHLMCHNDNASYADQRVFLKLFIDKGTSQKVALIGANTGLGNIIELKWY
jgi:hypothetical protein